MPKRIAIARSAVPEAIANHLSAEELLVRYRQATQPIERSHYQIMWLLATGKTPQEVGQVTGYTRIWIYQLVKLITSLINFLACLSLQRTINSSKSMKASYII